jgi:AraC-like DNA-binding protein
MTYLRRLRLHKVRDELAGSCANTATVAAVARRWGFLHRNRFAEQYARCSARARRRRCGLTSESMLYRLHDRPKDLKQLGHVNVIQAGSRRPPWRSDQAETNIFFGHDLEGRTQHIGAVAPHLGDVGQVDHQRLLNIAVPERYS